MGGEGASSTMSLCGRGKGTRMTLLWLVSVRNSYEEWRAIYTARSKIFCHPLGMLPPPANLVLVISYFALKVWWVAWRDAKRAP